MKTISTLALAASLVAGGFCLATPAFAQKVKAAQEEKARAKGKQPTQVTASTVQGRKLVLSKGAEGPLKALETGIKIKDPNYPASVSYTHLTLPTKRIV